jgi:S-adenosylmethionine:tRNA ribosyltransferase-isomerase
MADELDLYDFDLPRPLIAQEPVSHRADARLMHLNRADQSISHHHVRDLPQLLQAGDTLVVNDSKVLQARLIGFRTLTNGRWEGLFLRSDENGVAEMLCKTRGDIKVGELITLRDREGRESQQLVVAAQSQDGRMFLKPTSEDSWDEVLEKLGRVPLPPYIREGMMVDADRQRYQTVYARNAGSVAAPTAGLHFTPNLIQQLRGVGVAMVSVTLHVGIGTFRPIQSSTLAEHVMHSERGEISEAVVKRLLATRAELGRIIAVGTTSVRVLETAAIVNDGNLAAWRGETDIFIRPGYQFHAVDGLMTNFHLPKSTLLVLVSAFAGRDFIQRAYQEAIAEEYRFYSYGDCMLIL